MSEVVTIDPNPTTDWTAGDAAETYRFEEWGDGYFGVSERGTLVVHPNGSPDQSLDLLDIVEGLETRGLTAPVILRFPDLLRHRMTKLRDAFAAAIDEVGYGGRYSCLYPIKVNQQRQLCEAVVRFAGELDFGIEVGSKPELLAGLALTVGRNEMPLVCNGFKDDEFIETVVLAAKMGRNVIPVVEQFHELELIAKQAKAHKVRPKIGIRARLGAGGIGRWATSSGLRGKFGLSVSEVLQAVDYLKEHDLLDSLHLLHCHIGSQIYDIRTVKYAVSEVTHLYAELVKQGAPMGALDLGGGLGVDYDGTQTASPASSNYTVEQYALDVVHRIKSICDDASIDAPHIFSESGRALVSHCTAVICEAVASRRLPEAPNAALLERTLRGDVPQPLRDILDAYERMQGEGAAELDPLELFNDAAHAFEEAMSLFNLGYMDIAARAATEELYWCVGRRVIEMLGDEIPEELADLTATFADLYFVNLSIFQSMLDSWAIDQLFPIMPIHRLNDRPDRVGVLVDISCDSDGRIEQFQSSSGPKGTLDLHELIPARPGADQEFEPYYLGIFLTGAYQETLGDLHNLFGDTHAVHVVLDGTDGRWRIDEVVEGDTVREVLKYVQYDADVMREELRKDTETALAAGRLTLSEAVSLRRFLDEGLSGYTYLE
jgi:arginine decarboxylase